MSHPTQEHIPCSQVQVLQEVQVQCLWGVSSFFNPISKLYNLWTKEKSNWHLLTLCMCMLVIQLCPTLCDPMGCSCVHGILQARILEWVAVPFSRGSSWPRDRTWVAARIVGRFFTVWATDNAEKRKEMKTFKNNTEMAQNARKCR